jgi:hypothetical protein
LLSFPLAGLALEIEGFCLAVIEGCVELLDACDVSDEGQYPSEVFLLLGFIHPPPV